MVLDWWEFVIFAFFPIIYSFINFMWTQHKVNEIEKGFQEKYSDLLMKVAHYSREVKDHSDDIRAVKDILNRD
jgi:hypothetical protein